MKIVRVVFAVVLVFVTLAPSALAGSGDYEHKIVNYVALGDSIASGYGLEDARSESYVGRVARVLENRYGAVRLVNFGENGLRSEQLLDILVNDENKKYREYRCELQKADLITLSIGSNDLLQYLSLDTDLKEFREKGDEILSEACERFDENIPRIIDEICKQAPGAQLFVNNIYNPCNDSSFRIAEKYIDKLDTMAEQYIEKMNRGFTSEEVRSVFHSGNRGEGYTLVDVKRAFEETDDSLVNMGFSWRSVDPHPNKEGHRIIAEEIIPYISLEK